MLSQSFVVAKVLQGKNAFINGLTWSVLDKKEWGAEDGWYVCKYRKLKDKDLIILQPIKLINNEYDLRILLGLIHKDSEVLKEVLCKEDLLSDDILNDDRYKALKSLVCDFGLNINVYKSDDTVTSRYAEKLSRNILVKMFSKYTTDSN